MYLYANIYREYAAYLTTKNENSAYHTAYWYKLLIILTALLELKQTQLVVSITNLLISLGTINDAVYKAISPKLILSSILILKGGAVMVIKSGPV